MTSAYTSTSTNDKYIDELGFGLVLYSFGQTKCRAKEKKYDLIYDTK